VVDHEGAADVRAVHSVEHVEVEVDERCELHDAGGVTTTSIPPKACSAASNRLSDPREGARSDDCGRRRGCPCVGACIPSARLKRAVRPNACISASEQGAETVELRQCAWVPVSQPSRSCWSAPWRRRRGPAAGPEERGDGGEEAGGSAGHVATRTPQPRMTALVRIRKSPR
jgi:hypothetical protein